MAKNKINKNWIHDHINDPYVKLAQKEGYRARAAFKLKEIDEDEKLIKPGQVIVDLGCTPAAGPSTPGASWPARRAAACTAP
jgi:23S rRNA (uridine2552-2'-O)-methyltransferase